MDWMLSTGGVPSFVLIPLGIYYNNQYYTSDDCSSYLEELVMQLNCDDKKIHWRRRGLGFVNIIKTDLKPILTHCSDQPEMFRSTVRLLVELTTPIEILEFEDIPDHKINSSSLIIRDLMLHLYEAKEAFLDSTATRVVIDYGRRLLKNQPLSFEETECGNVCLLFFRNLLHAQQHPDQPSSDNSRQNQFVCNLFAQGFDVLLLDMLVSPHRDEWVAAIAQIIALLFKDRSVEDIQNRLITIMRSVTPDLSADDDESNMSSDQIDTFQKMTLSSNSSTSNNYSSTLNTKRQIEVQYLPTDDTISKILSESFVVDFMQKGFNILVGNLHHQLLRHEDVQLDKAQFFWLMAYFLGFISILNLDMKCIKDVLKIDILCYLTWEAQREAEKLEKWFQHQSLDIKPRRLHRCVTAIREYLTVLEINSNTEDESLDGSDESLGFEEWSNQLRMCLPAMRDLRQLFLLLLRQYNPNFQDHQYLRDVITTNYLLLLTLKRTHGYPAKPAYGGHFDFNDHLQQFCSITILTQYGTALEDFRTNSTVVNDSILTLLHYLKDDLGRTDLLCESVIISPFSKIWDFRLTEKSNILDDWHDLIVCALHDFMNNYRASGGFDDLRTYFRTASGLWDQKILQAKKTIYQFDTPTDSVAVSESQVDIKTAVDELRSLGFQKQLNWIQSSLLTTCSVQLGVYSGKEFFNPIACLSLRKNISCPSIVPWTEMEASALRSDRFCSLLNRLGLLPHPPQASFYPCIPLQWSVNNIYDVTRICGPIDQQKVNFDLALITEPEKLSRPNLGSIFDHTTGSLSGIWGPEKEPESSRSLSDVSSRVLKWIEEQSGITLLSPEREAESSALGDGLTEVTEILFETVSMEEL